MQSVIKKPKKPIGKSIRGFFIASIVLASVCLIVGVVYIWYTGRNDDGKFKDMQAAETITAPTIKASKVADNAPVGVSIQSVSSPVTPGSVVSVAVRTKPEAECTIKLEVDKKVVSDTNFIKKIANEYGGADWEWTLSSSTPVGKWPVTITCQKDKSIGVVSDEIEIVSNLPTN